MKRINVVIVLIIIVISMCVNSGCKLSKDKSLSQSSQQVYDEEGYDTQGFDKDGYDREGFNKKGYNRQGYLRRELDENGQPLLEKWGLAGVQTESVSNERPYSWYVDQGSTGPYSDINCVPASCVMALRWVNQSFNGTVEAARVSMLRDIIKPLDGIA